MLINIILYNRDQDLHMKVQPQNDQMTVNKTKTKHMTASLENASHNVPDVWSSARNSILSIGAETLVNQCLSVVVKSDQLQALARSSMPPLLQTQINTAISLHQTCSKVRISSL